MLKNSVIHNFFKLFFQINNFRGHLSFFTDKILPKYWLTYFKTAKNFAQNSKRKQNKSLQTSMEAESWGSVEAVIDFYK